MASTFMGLNISYSGLVASNAALNTTANNIANVETVGYSRQIVNQSASAAMRAFAGHGCIGAGVDTLGAERVRDIYYDEKYWNNNSKLGEYDKKQYYCSIIEEYLKYIHSLQELNIDIASEFLIMASELIHLKSKMLIGKTMEEEMEESEFQIQSEEDLKNKLIAYHGISRWWFN